jgi:tetratricopeptide (TPR) repeat protein
LEVTKLGEGSFIEAWNLGAQTCQRLAKSGSLKFSDVREMWSEFPYATPTTQGDVSISGSEELEKKFIADMDKLKEMREKYIERQYLRPLLENPGDHRTRMELAYTSIEAEDYNNAISVLMNLLDIDMRAEAYYLIGFSYANKKDFSSAVHFAEEVVRYAPQHQGYKRGLEFFREQEKE